MAGTGGVLRDAERRALPATPQKDPAAVSAIVSAERPKTTAPAADGSVLGEIEAVKFFGSTDFAEEHGLVKKVLAALGPGAKTVDDVSEALRNVRQDLM